MARNPISVVYEGTLLLAGDLVGLFAAFNVVHMIRVGEWLGIENWSFWWISGLTLIVLYVVNVYHSDPEESPTQLAIRTATGVVISGTLVASIVYVVKPWEQEALFWRGVLPVAMSVFLVWAVVLRIASARWMAHLSKSLRWLVLGYGDRARHLWMDFGGNRRNGSLHFVNVSEDERAADGEGKMPAPIGEIGALNQLLENTWSGAVIAMDQKPDDGVVSQLMQYRLQGLRVYDLTDFYERVLLKVPVLNLQDGWFALSHGFDLLHHKIELRIKRLFDLFLSISLMLLASPIMLAVAIAIKVDSEGPILYNQTRTGCGGMEFKVHKFRTMVKDAEKSGAQWAEENDPRVTRIGRFLRATRLDEFPQLWNVFVGEMSFIGPRPERPKFNRELEKEIPYYDLRHLIKPGITGWAQVMFAYGASIEDARVKLQYDLYYIKNYSLGLDFAIILKTIRVVLFGKGR